MKEKILLRVWYAYADRAAIGGKEQFSIMLHKPMFPGAMTPAQMVHKAANLAAAVLLTAAAVAAFTAIVIITI